MLIFQVCKYRNCSENPRISKLNCKLSPHSVGMPDLTLCRVCLVGDMRKQSIETIEFRRVYELLSKNQLLSEDGRPETLCYICYAHLQRCCTFSDMAQRSNKIFSYLLDNGIEKTQESVEKLIKVNPYRLTVTKQDVVSIDSTLESIDVPAAVAMEDTDSEEKGHVIKNLEECKPIKEEQDDDDQSEFLEIEIQGTDYDQNLKNPLELESSAEGVVNVSTTILLKQLKMYMGETELIESKDDNDTTIETPTADPMDTTHNIPSKRMKLYNECEVCHKVFHKRHDMDIHMRIHNGVHPYACNNCNQRFIQMTQLNEHIRTEHSGFRKCICTICNRIYTHTSHLKRHMAVHNSEQSVTCQLCLMPFKDKPKLQRHMSIHREKPKLYKCHDCKRSYKHKTLLLKHISVTHNVIQLFVCDICSQSFNNNIDLERHSLIHIDQKLKKRLDIKLYSCDLCEFKTAYSFSLRNHSLRIHDVK